MALNWNAGDYFSMLMHRDKRSHAALELLVDDLHANKEKTINRFLCHSGSEDFLWGLVKLLGNSNPRVAGNAAYIIGTLAESEFGSMRIIALTSSKHADSKQILPDLTNMLKFNDSESVMNAAGTMGTLAESHEGRSWMLNEACLDKTIQYVTELLSAENIWTASNAALVLARLTIAEEGCEHLLKHPISDLILRQLIASLGVDEAGRGMNAAFAIGRLCDLNVGRTRLLALSDSEKMISSLARMLCCSDPGASKNACFALSCLATNKEGHSRLLRNSQSEQVLRVLSELLSSEDSETGWFAAMTLHTLASQPKGCLRLRENANVLPALKAVEARDDVHEDLKEEVTQTIEILKRLEKPDPPQVQVNGSSEVELSWPAATTKSGFTVKYQVFENSSVAWSGTETKCTLHNRKPNTQYTYRLRAFTDGDNSPLSDATTVTTEESVPGPPTQLRVLGCTTTQLKIAWEPPEDTYGTLRGYYVYNGDKLVEHTTEQSIIITGLTSSTSYEIQVCAATSKGKGPFETITCSTAEMGAHAPSKPEVNVRGRSEMHITWRPPEVPLGRIFRYEVLCNGEVMYSGTDLHCVIRQLRSDTEYLISVCAVTSEGKCESKCTKKRTGKDEFDGERAPLYQAPVKTDSEKKADRPKSSKKRKSVGGSTSNSTTGATDNPRKASLSRANSASQAGQNKTKVKDNLPPLIRLSYTHGKQKDKENTDAPSTAVTRRASAHHQEAAPDKSELQSKKSNNELKRLQSVLGNKMPKQKGQGDDLAKNQESDLSRPKPTKLRSGHRRTSASRVVFQSHDQVRTPTGDVSQNKLCAAKSEEEEPKCQYSRRASHPHVRQSDCSNRLGLTRRGISQDKSLSHSMPEGFVDITIETLPMMHNGKQDTDISWIAHNRRAELQEGLAHVYGAAGLPSQSKSTQALKPGLMEFECPENMPHSAGSGKLRYGPMNYVQRASTFVSSHRPSPKKPLDKIRSNAPSFSQLRPELTLPASLTVRNHNKFVPMQFRTQPANLPSTLSRQNTQTAPENNFSHSDSLSRSQSDVSARLVDNNFSSPRPALSVPNSAIKHKDRILSSSGTKQLLSKTLSADFAATAQSGELQNGAILVSPHDAPSGESIIGIGVSTTHDNNTLQSAR